MKIRWTILGCAAALLLGAGGYQAGRMSIAKSDTFLKWNPANKTIEIWKAGELTEEYQEDDGQIYRELIMMVTGAYQTHPDTPQPDVVKVVLTAGR